MKTIPQAITFTLLSAIVGISFVAFTNLSFADPEMNFLGETKRVELAPRSAITQVVHIEKNQLEGFQIFMGDTDLGIGERLDFSLSDPTCHKVFAHSSRTFFSFPSVRDIRFRFDPIRESIDQVYCLSIEYRSGLIKRKDRPYIRATDDEQFKDISYIDHGKEKTYPGRTLQIRPLYAPNSLHDRLMELENRLSQYKPAFAKGSMLALGIAGAFLGIVFFIWIARRED